MTKFCVAENVMFLINYSFKGGVKFMRNGREVCDLNSTRFMSICAGFIIRSAKLFDLLIVFLLFWYSID